MSGFDRMFTLNSDTLIILAIGLLLLGAAWLTYEARRAPAPVEEDNQDG